MKGKAGEPRGQLVYAKFGEVRSPQYKPLGLHVMGLDPLSVEMQFIDVLPPLSHLGALV